MKTVLYYFSGTGNSLWLAERIRENLKGCEIKPIAGLIHHNQRIEADAVGFVFPLYYYGIPEIVKRFIENNDFLGARYVFTAVTHGGPSFMEGGAVTQLENLLKKKGIKLNSSFMVWMSTNFIIDYKAFPDFLVKILFQLAGKKAGKIARIVHSNKEYHERGNTKLDNSPVYRDFISSCFFSDENYRAEESCNSCGICEKVCPVGNIKLVDGKPKWNHQCQLCMACIHFCPKEAIQYAGKTAGKKRYKNPYIKAGDMLKQRILE